MSWNVPADAVHFSNCTSTTSSTVLGSSPRGQSPARQTRQSGQRSRNQTAATPPKATRTKGTVVAMPALIAMAAVDFVVVPCERVAVRGAVREAAKVAVHVGNLRQLCHRHAAPVVAALLVGTWAHHCRKQRAQHSPSVSTHVPMLPWPATRHVLRSHAVPVKPFWHTHSPLTRLHTPRFEHSAMACATS